jgi:putative transposase
MFWSVVYLALRRIFQLVVLALRHDRAKEIEILVLRHQIAVLRLWDSKTQSQGLELRGCI